MEKLKKRAHKALFRIFLSPRYCCGKAARSWAWGGKGLGLGGDTLMGTKVHLLKLSAKPVQFANSSSFTLSRATWVMSAHRRITVSLAYWSIGALQGMIGGCWRPPSMLMTRTSRCSTSASRMKR